MTFASGPFTHLEGRISGMRGRQHRFASFPPFKMFGPALMFRNHMQKMSLSVATHSFSPLHTRFID